MGVGVSAGPRKGSLLSLIVGTGISTQIGFEPKAFKKLQSCFVAAEAACSRGDFPVVAVDTALAAVLGFATAMDTAALPAELAAVVVAPPKAIKGAAQPVAPKLSMKTPKTT